MSTTIIEDNWKEYLAKVYPNGVIEQQHYHIRNAFYAGVTVVLTSIQETSNNTNKTEHDVDKVFTDMVKEVEVFMLQRKVMLYLKQILKPMQPATGNKLPTTDEPTSFST